MWKREGEREEMAAEGKHTSLRYAWHDGRNEKENVIPRAAKIGGDCKLYSECRKIKAAGRYELVKLEPSISKRKFPRKEAWKKKTMMKVD